MSKKQSLKKLKCDIFFMTEQDENAIAGMVAGGIIGGVVGGPVGAMIGGIVGLILGASDSKKTKRRR